VYDVDDGDLFLVGTSEVPLSALHRGDTFSPDVLPPANAGYSSCFRREAGTYGKDTRGIFRVHQFDKVEMFSWCAPASRGTSSSAILAIEEQIIGGLGLPYHVGEHRGRATSARPRPRIRHRSVASFGREVPRAHVVLQLHRLLGAPARRPREGHRRLHVRTTRSRHRVRDQPHLVFLFEHYQDPDGGFVVPDVLRPYVTFERVEPRK